MTAMKAEVEPTGRPTNASLTRRTPWARQFSSTSSGSAWWSATKKNSRTGSTPPVFDMPSGGEVSTMQWRPAGRRPSFGSCSSMPQRATRLRFWGWPRLPVRMRTSLAPSSCRIGAQQDGAAQRVGVAHPLGEDVGAAAADGLGAALQAHVGGVGLGEDGQVLLGASLAQERPKRPTTTWALGQTRGLEHAGDPLARPLARPLPRLTSVLRTPAPGQRPAWKRPSCFAMSTSMRGGSEALAVLRRAAARASPPRSARPRWSR